jgi:hypothetical protein
MNIRQRQTTAQHSALLAPTHSPFVIVRQPRRIHDLDALAEPNHVGALPPLGHRVLRRLALGAHVALVVGINEAAEPRAVAAHDNDGLADPALQVLDVAAAGAAEGVDDVDEVRGNVAQHVDEAAGGAEGHDHGLVLDEAQGLGVQRVPEHVVAAAGGQGRRVDGRVFGVRVDRLQLLARGAGGG